MTFLAFLLVAIVAFLVGGMLGITVKARQEARQLVRDQFTAAGIDRDTARRYRIAAKILHDLIHVNDLDELIPVLPAPMQQRVEDWLAEHNAAIRTGTTKRKG